MNEEDVAQNQQLLRLIASLLAVLVLVSVGAALYFAQPVIVPFALALFGAFAVEPAVRALGRVRVPRWLAALILTGTLYVLVQSLVSVLADVVLQVQERLPAYLTVLQEVVGGLPQPWQGSQSVRLDDPAFWAQLLPVGAMMGSVGEWAGAITGIVANTFLVVLLMVAIVIGRRQFDARLNLAAGGATGRSEEARRVLAAIDEGIQRYMLLKTLLSIAMGTSFWLVLSLFGADFALLWAVLAGVMNFIPTLGPLIATTPPVILILVQFSSTLGYGLLAATALIVIPAVFGNLIEPKVFGDKLNLNFFAVLFALLLWSFLWGVAGAVLSVPIMMAISLVCREVSSLRPVHDLLRA